MDADAEQTDDNRFAAWRKCGQGIARTAVRQAPVVGGVGGRVEFAVDPSTAAGMQPDCLLSKPCRWNYRKYSLGCLLGLWLNQAATSMKNDKKIEILSLSIAFF